MPFADDLASRVFERLAAIDFPNIVELGPKHGYQNTDDSLPDAKKPRTDDRFGIYVYRRPFMRPLFLRIRKQEYLSRNRKESGVFLPFHEWLLSYIRDVEGYIEAISDNPEKYLNEMSEFQWKDNEEKQGCYKLFTGGKEIRNDDDLFEITKTTSSLHPNVSRYEYISVFTDESPSYWYASIVTTQYFLLEKCFLYIDDKKERSYHIFRDFWRHLQNENKEGVETNDYEALRDLEEYIFYLFCKVRALRLHCSSSTSKEKMNDDTLKKTTEQCQETIKSIHKILVNYNLEKPPLRGNKSLVDCLYENVNSDALARRKQLVKGALMDDSTADPEWVQGVGEEGGDQKDSEVRTPPRTPRLQETIAGDQLRGTPR